MNKIILFFLLGNLVTFASAESTNCKLAKRYLSYPFTEIEYFEIDLDKNKTKDLFLIDGSQGMAGAPFKVFINTGTTYDPAGEVFIHSSALELIKNKNSSVSLLLTYIREGADSGKLVTYELTGKEYKKIKSEKIPSSEYGKRLSPEKIKTVKEICP